MRALTLTLLALTTQAAAEEPTLRRIVLSSGGVGQFEFEADVTSAATLQLDIPLDQVDDVLKSLTVDDAAGPAQSVRLPGQQPLAESFRTLPFKPDAFASPEALLASLVGERVRIASIGATGAILSVSTFEAPAALGQQGATRHRLTIATDDGIVSTVLEDTPDIAFSSETLRGQIATALAAIAAQRVQDRRTLTITLADGPARHVRFAYVVPVPVWKTTYRITLAADPAQPAHLEAFAVVENLSGRDWKGADVTLTSGRPVLYHTPLYQPVFSSRPEAPVSEAAGLAPSVDSYAAVRAPMEQSEQAPAPPPPPPQIAAPPPAFIPPPEINVKAAPQVSARGIGRLGGYRGAAYQPPPAAIDQSIAQVDFHLTAPVTAGSGQSLLLPIIDRPVPARRIAYFQPETDPVHPLVALQLTNDTGGALPPGLVTLFDTGKDNQSAYVGDARIPAIEPGEQRLASFALDLATTIDVTHHATEHITGGTIAQGTLTLRQQERRVTDYRVTTPKSGARTLVVEQTKSPDTTLAEPTGKSVTTTPEIWRVTQDVPAGATQIIELITEQTTDDTRALAGLEGPAAVMFASNADLPEKLRQAIRHAADLNQIAENLQAQLDTLQTRSSDIVTDQERLRSNLAAVPQNSALQRRYLNMLQSQENELDDLRRQGDALEKQVSGANDALTAYVQGLRME